MKIEVKKPFDFAREGIFVEHYAAGIHDVSERCAEVALGEGWAAAADQDGGRKKGRDKGAGTGESAGPRSSEPAPAPEPGGRAAEKETGQ